MLPLHLLHASRVLVTYLCVQLLAHALEERTLDEPRRRVVIPQLRPLDLREARSLLEGLLPSQPGKTVCHYLPKYRFRSARRSTAARCSGPLCTVAARRLSYSVS